MIKSYRSRLFKASMYAPVQVIDKKSNVLKKKKKYPRAGEWTPGYDDTLEVQCQFLITFLTFIRYAKLLSLKTSLRKTMSSLWLASGLSCEVSRANVSWSPKRTTTTTRRRRKRMKEHDRGGRDDIKGLISPAPAVSTGMASFMEPPGEEEEE